MRLKYFIDSDFHGQPLEKFLKYKINLSQRFLRKLKAHQRIYCNGVIHKVFMPVFSGDIIEIDINFDEETPFLEPQDIPLEILFENDGLIAINKKPGIVVHPTANHSSGTIANGLSFYFIKNNLHLKVRPVSRLDKGTSGVIVFAKNPMVQEALINQMNTGQFKKEYIGVVYGSIAPSQGTIDLPIGRKEGSTIEREISEKGSRAVTHYKVLKSYPSSSLLKFRLETGRTHQIRVHCLSIGHPLIGDTLYYDPSCSLSNTNLISRQALHARRVQFIDPMTEKKVTITAKTPDDIISLISNTP